MVVRLSGWRAAWAMTRGIKVPLSEIVSVDHDPGVYSRVPTKTRMIATKQRTGLIKLGAYHSLQGWSFWACGAGRNAIVIETNVRRHATVVVEVENPVATVRELREAAGLPVLGATPGALPAENRPVVGAADGGSREERRQKDRRGERTGRTRRRDGGRGDGTATTPPSGMASGESGDDAS